MTSCPTRCWLVVSRTDCFCPEKSSGQLHLVERSALKEKADLDEKLRDVVVHTAIPCIIMPEDTFHELCPGWRKLAEEKAQQVVYVCHNCGGTMTGDGFAAPYHCENVEAPEDAEPDSGPYYCGWPHDHSEEQKEQT